MVSYRCMLTIAVLCVACLMTSVMAEEKADKPKEEYLIGKVLAKKDDKGVVTAVTLTVVDFNDDDEEITVVYKVTLDKVAEKMAKELSGKEVDVTCTIANKGTKEKPELWVTVTKYKEVKEEEDEE